MRKVCQMKTQKEEEKELFKESRDIKGIKIFFGVP